ncbi:MAG: DUF4062 domain-containing protein [Clostridia bacterium]|nr:DUF4062 domain-containing protein [Clostridia bacterium]
MEKMYSAFISSTSKLEKYRKIATETLMDCGFFCHAMEHFTVENFDQIKWHIRVSDFVLLLMGADYGTEDPIEQKSMTRLEFEYAREIKKPILVVVTPEFEAMQKKKSKTREEKKQVDFLIEITNNHQHFTRVITETLTLEKIINQYVSNPQTDFSGWIRDEIVGRELADWQEKHKAYDLRGKWYHFHYSDKDPLYLRLGTIDVKQNFTPTGFQTCRFVGKNYGVELNCDKTAILVDENGDPLTDDESQSKWNGEYSLQSDDMTYTGIYSNERQYEQANFAGEDEHNKKPRGIHDFTLDIDSHEELTVEFRGLFHDQAPSKKCGKIYVFRDVKERDRKVKERLRRKVKTEIEYV